MLYLDAGLELNGLTIYRDYNDRARFYYMPRAPRLSMEAGQPMFQLLIYRRGEVGAVGETGTVTGGGFLTMTVDLGVPTSTLEAVISELSSRFGVRAMLLPVPVENGTVRITLLDSSTAGASEPKQGPRFVEKILASAKPSLYGDERAAFTAELTHEGAILMRAALQQPGATPVVVVYDLEYRGLHPAYECTITIKFHQAYHYLRNRAQLQTLWFHSDIDTEMEQLRKEGAIVIQEVNYEREEPSARAERMQQLQNLAKELAQWTFFKPGLNPGEVLAKDRGSMTIADPAASLAAITDGLTSRGAAALTGVGATEDVGSPRRPGLALATNAVEQPTVEPPSRPTQPTQPSGSTQPTAVEAWNRAGRPQGGFLLRDLSQEERQEITYNLRQVGTVNRSMAPQGQIRMLPGAADLNGRILDIDLNDRFFETIAGTVTTSADLASLGVANAIVKLRYGENPDGTRYKDTAEIVLTTASERPKYRFFVDGKRSQTIEYKVVLNYKADYAIGFEAITEETPWIATTTRHIEVDPRRLGSVIHVDVQSAVVDWNVVRQIQAEIRYEDSTVSLQATETRVLSQAAPTAQVAIRPRNAQKKDVQVRCTFFYADGDSEQLTYQHSGDEPFIVNQPPERTTLVNLTLADPMRRYERIAVQLARADADGGETVRTLGGSAPTASWSFRRRTPTDTSYRYRSTAFFSDGSVKESDWQTTDNPLLVVGDKAAGILSVTVLFGSSFVEAGIKLARVKLIYDAAPDWADRDVEKVFRSDNDTLSWRVPMTRLDARSYRYEVTWIGTDGKTTSTGSQTSSDETLILDPPAR